jgi:hypothetical protein
MSGIIFQCACGNPLKAREELAGKRTKCPKCGAMLTIPGGAKTTAATAAASSHATASTGHMTDNPDAVPIDDLSWPTQDATGAAGVTGAAGGEHAAQDAAPTSLEPVRPADQPKVEGVMQYKVLGQSDHSASGKFNPMRLEAVLNDHARQGWNFKGAVVINMPSHSGNHDEMIVFLER